MESGYQSAMRLSNLLEDVTLITRITDAKATLPICPVNVKDVIDGICEEVAQYKPENRMRIHVDVADNVAVEGNRQLIDAIFRNLINNAIAYSGVATSIFLQSRKIPATTNSTSTTMAQA